MDVWLGDEPQPFVYRIWRCDDGAAATNVRYFDMQIREETETGSFVNIENLLCRTLNSPMNAHTVTAATQTQAIWIWAKSKANFAC